jgi:hypothetical protein
MTRDRSVVETGRPAAVREHVRRLIATLRIAADRPVTAVGQRWLTPVSSSAAAHSRLPTAASAAFRLSRASVTLPRARTGRKLAVPHTGLGRGAQLR